MPSSVTDMPNVTEPYSVTEHVAHALAFRWGKPQESPPERADRLLAELTAALQEAQEGGKKTRAEFLEAVISALARGIAKHKRQTEGGFHTATLEQAMAEIRAHERRKERSPSESNAAEDVPRGRRAEADRTLQLSLCQR